MGDTLRIRLKDTGSLSGEEFQAGLFESVFFSSQDTKKKDRFNYEPPRVISASSPANTSDDADSTMRARSLITPTARARMVTQEPVDGQVQTLSQHNPVGVGPTRLDLPIGPLSGTQILSNPVLRPDMLRGPVQDSGRVDILSSRARPDISTSGSLHDSGLSNPVRPDMPQGPLQDSGRTQILINPVRPDMSQWPLQDSGRTQILSNPVRPDMSQWPLQDSGRTQILSNPVRPDMPQGPLQDSGRTQINPVRPDMSQWPRQDSGRTQILSNPVRSDMSQGPLQDSGRTQILSNPVRPDMSQGLLHDSGRTQILSNSVRPDMSQGPLQDSGRTQILSNLVRPDLSSSPGPEPSMSSSRSSNTNPSGAFMPNSQALPVRGIANDRNSDALNKPSIEIPSPKSNSGVLYDASSQNENRRINTLAESAENVAKLGLAGNSRTDMQGRSGADVISAINSRFGVSDSIFATRSSEAVSASLTGATRAESKVPLTTRPEQGNAAESIAASATGRSQIGGLLSVQALTRSETTDPAPTKRDTVGGSAATASAAVARSETSATTSATVARSDTSATASAAVVRSETAVTASVAVVRSETSATATATVARGETAGTASAAVARSETAGTALPASPRSETSTAASAAITRSETSGNSAAVARIEVGTVSPAMVRTEAASTRIVASDVASVLAGRSVNGNNTAPSGTVDILTRKDATVYVGSGDRVTFNVTAHTQAGEIRTSAAPSIKSGADISIKGSMASSQDSSTRNSGDECGDSHINLQNTTAETSYISDKRTTGKKRYTFGTELAIFMAATAIASARHRRKIKRATISGDSSLALTALGGGELSLAAVVALSESGSEYVSSQNQTDLSQTIRVERSLGSRLARASTAEDVSAHSYQVPEDQSNSSKHAHDQSGSRSTKTLYRPTWLISKNETLVSIAEACFDDANVAWLIADLNIDKLSESWIDGKRVVEVRSRQKLELPVQDDIAEFYATRPRAATAENLVTIVNESSLDGDLRLQSVLSMFNSTTPGSLKVQSSIGASGAFNLFQSEPFVGGEPVVGVV